jgi:hypothetical protein
VAHKYNVATYLIENALADSTEKLSLIIFCGPRRLCMEINTKSLGTTTSETERDAALLALHAVVQSLEP